MPAFKSIHVIFNPNSTGDSPAMAHKFSADAEELFPDIVVKLIETKHAGHAEELAYEITRDTPSPLIISVSGDGGYHELLNGALKAADEGLGEPFCAVLPGGNANDHYNHVYNRPLLVAMQQGKSTNLDVLSVSHGKWMRYAHSYVGLGITPRVGIELNKHSLNPLREVILCVRSFWKFRPFEMNYQGRLQEFDSFIVSNIEAMAKVITLDEASDPADGVFEVIIWPHGRKRQLLGILLRSVLGKGVVPEKSSKVEFTTSTKLPMQLDGEITDLPAATTVTIKLVRGKLRTFL